MKVVYVDGFAIRNTLDPNFEVCCRRTTDICLPYPKFFIPQGEVWIDAPLKEETELMLKLDRYYYEEKSQEETKRILGESKFVDQQREYIKSLCKKGPVPEFREREEQSGGVSIVYVNGRVVREYLDPEFTFGGHDQVYSYIPKAEVWIDVVMDPGETKYVVLHETLERRLMEEEGKPYDIAHDMAIVAEKEMRLNDGVAMYPDYEGYQWRGMSDEEIIEKFYLEK